MRVCFDCKQPAKHRHRVVPRSLGGTSTVPLCARCHGLVKGKDLAKSALAAKAARGERTGGVAYGWRVCEDGVHLEHDPVEQTILGIVVNLRTLGLSQSAIVAYLTEKGLFSRSGKAFHKTSVARMLAA